MRVRCIEQGGVFKELLDVAEGSTVESVLRLAGARLDVAKTIKVNNEPAELDDIVENNDSVFVIPNIAGNI